MRLQFRFKMVQVVIDATDIKDAMRQLSDVAEVFSYETCGICSSDAIYPNVRRTKEGYEYFEMFCHACKARKSFGQIQGKQQLFAKGGWEKSPGGVNNGPPLEDPRW